MNQLRWSLFILVLLFLAAWAPAGVAQPVPTPLSEDREAVIRDLARAHQLSAAQVASVRAVFDASPYISTGNPTVTHHPMTPSACQEMLAAAAVSIADPAFELICGAPLMAPLYDPATETPAEAHACIDQLEFPNIPCAYPVVWVRANEAAALCEAVGKRLCDAHEWEGACAGALEPPDYTFDLASAASASEAVATRRFAHNRAVEGQKSWSYGPVRRNGVCAMGSTKTDGCNGGDWRGCGSNTYPAGSFPACHSPLGVYDLNGNAAEHMNLPLAPDQMASRGSTILGVTEMKGSWFIFDTYKAHEDWCRWRAPFWHGSRVLDPASHHNYHLSFRCCKSLGPSRLHRPKVGRLSQDFEIDSFRPVSRLVESRKGPARKISQ